MCARMCKADLMCKKLPVQLGKEVWRQTHGPAIPEPATPPIPLRGDSACGPEQAIPVRVSLLLYFFVYVRAYGRVGDCACVHFR